MNLSLTDAAAFASILVIVFGGVRALFLFWQHRRDRVKEKRELRRNDLLGWMKIVQDALAEYDQWLAVINTTRSIDPDELVYMRTKDYGRIIGEARKGLLAVGDPELNRIAEQVLTPYFPVDEDDSEVFKIYGEFKNRNRKGLTEAVKRFAELLKDAN